MLAAVIYLSDFRETLEALMAAGSDKEQNSTTTDQNGRSAGIALALTVAALAAVGAGIAIQQFLERRLSKPELARLKFYRYLRERGRLES
jgi:hypothetical protein